MGVGRNTVSHGSPVTAWLSCSSLWFNILVTCSRLRWLRLSWLYSTIKFKQHIALDVSFAAAGNTASPQCLQHVHVCQSMVDINWESNITNETVSHHQWRWYQWQSVDGVSHQSGRWWVVSSEQPAAPLGLVKHIMWLYSATTATRLIIQWN